MAGDGDRPRKITADAVKITRLDAEGRPIPGESTVLAGQVTIEVGVSEAGGGRLARLMRLRPPNRLDRWWYRHVGVPQPRATSPTRGALARLVPYRWRALHRAYAAAFGFFWLPCPLCDRPFGGHEWGQSIPDPLRPDTGHLAICSACSRQRTQG